MKLVGLNAIEKFAVNYVTVDPYLAPEQKAGDAD